MLRIETGKSCTHKRTIKQLHADLVTHIINLRHGLIDGTPLSMPMIPAIPALTPTTELQATRSDNR